jgi:uncharacterized protein YrrD
VLRSLKSVTGYTLRATDGDIGKVSDFFFEDLSWIVRYLVVDTGDWLEERLVLISPATAGEPDWDTRTVPVALSRAQVENSPPISVDEPVSRQMEAEIHNYYNWVPYWRAAVPIPASGAVAASAARAEEAREAASSEEAAGDPHLRSADEVTGYHIHATDGEIGHVEDLIVDDEAWTIRYVVVDTRNWLPGRKVLVSPAWVEQVDWVQRMVYVNLQRETIKDSPEYDPSAPVNRDYETRLYDYYGRPKYWV